MEEPTVPSETHAAASARCGTEGRIRAGEACPRCGQDVLKYNGLLELACPSCDFREGGGFT